MSLWKFELICVQVNVIALMICTREAVKLMREKGIDDGHVVHISRFVVMSFKVISYQSHGHYFTACPGIVWWGTTSQCTRPPSLPCARFSRVTEPN